MSEPFLLARGTSSLRGERWPGGPAVVVLLHAGVADLRSWRVVADALVDHATVLAYDRRGYGQSAPASEPFSHVDDLLAVLDAVATSAHGGRDPQGAWLVGSSLGGGLALDATLAAPDQVAGLVLLAPAVSGAPEPELDPDILSFFERISAAESGGDLDEVNRLETWLWLDGPAGPEGRVAGESRALALDMNATILRHGVPEDIGSSGIDAWSRLDDVTVPVTVACGDRDVPFLVSRSRELAARLPRARHRLLDGMAHLPYLEQPGVVATLVADALEAT